MLLDLLWFWKLKRQERKLTKAWDMAKRRERDESLTDLARVRAKTEEDFERDIASDPDWKDVPLDWYKDAEAVVPKKE